MTLESKWKRAYFLQCDECGDLGPKGFFKIDAVRQAEARGWSAKSELASVPQGEKDLCPFCVKVVDDREAYRDYRDEQEQKAAVRAGVG